MSSVSTSVIRECNDVISENCLVLSQAFTCRLQKKTYESFINLSSETSVRKIYISIHPKIEYWFGYLSGYHGISQQVF